MILHCVLLKLLALTDSAPRQSELETMDMPLPIVDAIMSSKAKITPYHRPLLSSWPIDPCLDPPPLLPAPNPRSNAPQGSTDNHRMGAGQ